MVEGAQTQAGQKKALLARKLIEIPKNIAHRIENKNTDFPLEIIEFQVGNHLSDSDIVRLDDIYGRTA